MEFDEVVPDGPMQVPGFEPAPKIKIEPIKIDKGLVWIARDADNDLYLYDERPDLVQSAGYYKHPYDDGEVIQLPSKLLPEITFLNSPIKVYLDLIITKP